MSWPQPLPILEKLGQQIVKKSKGVFSGYEVMYGEVNLTTSTARIVDAMTVLRDTPEFGFSILIDVCGADYPEREKRFDVVYHLLSMTKNHRVRVKVQTNEATAVPSITPLFRGADWFEREAFDMLGIYFDGHPDLRRILMPEDYEGHPQRRDFPVGGEPVIFTRDETKWLEARE